MSIEETILDRIDGLLDMPRVDLWDGIRVADMNPTQFASMDDLKAEDWPHRIYWRQFDPSGEHMECMREISMKQARALGAKRFYPGRLVERCWQSIKSPEISFRFPMVMRGNEMLSLRTSAQESRSLEKLSKVSSVISLMLMERYQWIVRFRLAPDTLAVSLDTDPEGARQAFQLRDVPPGKKRRAALRNWVSMHSRKNRAGSDLHLVQAHLRGETKFNWNGLECELIPSQFDREKEIERKAEVNR